MPRRYTIDIEMPDEYLEAGDTPQVDEIAIRNGDLPIFELISLQEHDPEIKVTIVVTDI